MKLTDEHIHDMVQRARIDADKLDAVFTGTAIGGRFRMYGDALEELKADRDRWRALAQPVVDATRADQRLDR